jgi:hypothetical protein
MLESDSGEIDVGCLMTTFIRQGGIGSGVRVVLPLAKTDHFVT